MTQAKFYGLNLEITIND